MTLPADDELRAILEAASPRPWTLETSDWLTVVSDANGVTVSDDVEFYPAAVTREDAALIVLAPALVEEVLRLRAALREIAFDDETLGPYRAYANRRIARTALGEGNENQ